MIQLYPVSLEKWEDTAQKADPSWYLDPIVALQKREAHLACLRKWAPRETPKRVLKTDLFEEAFGEDTVMQDLFPQAEMKFGVDIALSTVRGARSRLTSGTDQFAVADVRSLPIQSNSIDLIYSGSTLDHFESAKEFRQAIAELVRVLKPGGRIIITMDNLSNPMYRVLRRVTRTRFGPFPLGYTTTAEGLKSALGDAGLNVLGGEFLIHNPRLLSTMLFMGTRFLFRKHADGPIRLMLGLFDSLRHLGSERFTACFVSACAEKAVVTPMKKPNTQESLQEFAMR